ncbi:hypothetical protein WHR41_00695 [Cladosporium halotolerans]|uniref:Methyltransferase type 11 domain-containing protein n=1 Tax=Cladosporium halotolerans TaxID=1052096 RepID=A0AB34L0P4_9PEZI
MASTNHTTSDLYTLWAPTYDTDGNILQAIDSAQLTTSLLPTLSALLSQRPNTEPLTLLDLGSGTGRTTLLLAAHPWPNPPALTACDSSAAMLAVARAKCPDTVSFALCDPFSPSSSTLPDAAFDGVTSTLVLEHIPLQTYFRTLASLLKPGGLAAVTNMHPDMGAGTQAGFKDEGGVRLKGESFVHGVRESVEAAREAGLERVGDVREVEVDEGMLEGFGEGVRKGARKWVGRRVWFGLVLRKREEREA